MDEIFNYRIHEIKIDTKFKFRIEPQTSEIETIKESIRKNGLLNPIKIVSVGTHFEVISGRTRFIAAKELGLKTIPCQVIHTNDDFELLRISIIDNSMRYDLSPLEKSNQVRMLREDHIQTVPEISSLMGLSERNVYDLLKIQEMPHLLQKAIHDKALTVQGGLELMRLPIKYREWVTSQAITGSWSVRRIKHEKWKTGHPFYDQKPDNAKYVALKYMRYPETEKLRNNFYRIYQKRMAGPHKCETGILYKASTQDPPYVCSNDSEWVVVSRGHIRNGIQVLHPSDNPQDWVSRGAYCKECTDTMYPGLEYHKETCFTIPMRNMTSPLS